MSANRHETADQVLWWATNPRDRAELEVYAKKGVLVPIGYRKMPTVGPRCLVYRETRSLVGAILEGLEADGLAVRTGETRPGRHGRMEPVYVAVPQATNRSDPAKL
jgi:hypothetical protein